ncbi:peroxiredoxin-like family protein [Flavobacterium sp. MC2016-06]|jgi:peroxiredoxin|uniref:peroxiredoxin-like family protein n=1 Tax=Flavobacterium sp. MC2016-06 TaxID=2676308 RepID=UPI0012BA8096|nr:peroxiredoxin-like family protein [Flavobacterium sp. MC2016-06]MBU3861021.1 AhpC/TSA family protein [Flavobacterium sp. MC2016-06]
MSLKEKLAALKIEAETKLLPAHAVEILHRATNELIASGAQERVLKIGDTAPSFKAFDSDGNLVSSEILLEKGPIVLTFYRGVWCPYCNLDLQALEETRAEFESKGATLIAVSQQTAANSRKSQRTNNLGFPILSDVGGEIADSFKVRWNLPDYLIEVHKELGADLSVFNGENSWTLPMPARYVIGKDGIIAYAEVNADYTTRPEPSEVLPVLETLLVN